MSKPEGFDLASLSVAESTFVHLKNPATEELLYVTKGDKELPVGIHVNGPGSKVYRQAQSAVTNSNIRAGRKQITAERISEQRFEILARCSHSFENFHYKGQDCSLETCRALYADDALGWVREQVEAVMGDYGAFLPDASKG